MAETVTTKVKGLKELLAALEQLSKRDAARAIREGLDAGSTVIREAMISEAPKDSGFLAKHFNVKFSVKGLALTGSAFIGPQGHMDYPLAGGGYTNKTNRRGKKYKSGRIPVVAVARFLEFGTAERKTGEGANRGRMTANPFITRAFESSKSLAIFRVIAALKNRLRLT